MCLDNPFFQAVKNLLTIQFLILDILKCVGIQVGKNPQFNYAFWLHVI
jgi:hypothetical protein